MLDALGPVRVVALGLSVRAGRALHGALARRNAQVVTSGTAGGDDVLVVAGAAQLAAALQSGSRPRVTIAVVAPGQGEQLAGALAAGADDVVADDVTADEFLARLDRAARLAEALLPLSVQGPLGELPALLGESESMRNLRPLVDTVAQGRSAVVVRGETGTGRALVAHHLHHRSAAAAGSLLDVDCRSLGPRGARDILEGGVIARAHGGTLLLRRIDALGARSIDELLPPLTTGRLASGRLAGRHLSFRTIVTTDGGGRELGGLPGVVTIQLPPLRERHGDIAVLARHFVAPRECTQSAVEALEAYPWPRNVAELRAVCRLAAARCPARVVAADALSEALLPLHGPGDPVSLSIAEVERRHVLRVLAACGGNRTRAAQVLGIAPRTLYNRLRQYHER